MDGPTVDRMPSFNTIGFREKHYLDIAMKRRLSGYLGGMAKSGGYFINRLSDEWSTVFDCKHAIPCNSATSGLLAACMAIGIRPGDVVWTTPYSMSATAACAKVLGAEILFIDIETLRFSMNMNNFPSTSLKTLPAAIPPTAIIVTNLFGHPAYLSAMRAWCDANKVWMIEDNAQAPFAMEGNKYAGTVGHIGVFSFNVHKHIQCGEGGVIVTDDDQIGVRLAEGINHGELAGGLVGLNLRMAEPIAAIACAQLSKAARIIEGRRELALRITDMVGGIPWIMPQVDAPDCQHVYYRWVARVSNNRRKEFVEALNARGVPMVEGYSPPLNRVFKSEQMCPVAEHMEDHELISFGICEWDLKTRHLDQMREVIQFVAGEMT